jgi:hypothetical protein
MLYDAYACRLPGCESRCVDFSAMEEVVLDEEPYVWTRHMSSAGLLPS